MEQPHFDRKALIAEVAKRHKILLDPDDPALALITINEIVLSRAIAIVEAKLEEMEQRLAHVSEKQTETAKAIGEAIITASAAYVAERLKDVGADLRSGVTLPPQGSFGSTQTAPQGQRRPSEKRSGNFRGRTCRSDRPHARLCGEACQDEEASCCCLPATRRISKLAAAFSTSMVDTNDRRRWSELSERHPIKEFPA